MGRGSEKSLTNKLLGSLRRAWSFPKIRFATISIIILFLFIYLFSNSSSNEESQNTSFLSIYHEPFHSQTNNAHNYNNKRIACLIVGDTVVLEKHGKQRHGENVQELFDFLQIYDKYLSPYCDVKIFLVNTSIGEYPFISNIIETKLLHSEVTFIPRNNERYWKSRRIDTYHILAYSYRYYPNYEWYLKFHDTNVLILVDHFKQLIYDKNGYNKYNMHKPKLIGHAIKDDCNDFIYSLTVYAFNNQFLNTIGKIAVNHIENDKLLIDNFMECKTYSRCKHHTEDDFAGFCLKDLGIYITPTRDEKDREYFLIFQIRDHYVKMNEYVQDDWYWIGKNENSVGKQCCADYPVVFANYKNPKLLRKDYQQIYAVNPEQRNMKFLSKVREFDDSPIELPPNVTLFPRIIDPQFKAKLRNNRLIEEQNKRNHNI